MKKIICFLMSFILIFGCSTVPAFAESSVSLNINQKNISHDVSENLYGVFLEDISYAGDGGLVSNLVCNNSFEYPDKPENAWIFDNLDVVLSNSDAMNENNKTYETITVNGKGTVENIGFTELYDYKTYDYNEHSAQKADMGFIEGVSYDFSCYLKNIDFEGNISVYLNSKSNSKNITQLSTSNVGKNNWGKVSAQLTSAATEDGSLVIEFNGTGSICLDFVSLTPENAYGFGSEEWKYVTLRKDLFESLQNLNPSFIRFPGGCLAEGTSLEELYSWKDTIGDTVSRKQSANIWANNDNGNYYINTNSMGYHEYFQLCEDLGAKAIPVVNVGITCQARNGYNDHVLALKKVSMSDEQWKSYMVSELGYDEKDEEGMNQFTTIINDCNIHSQDDFEKYLDTIAFRPGTDEFDNYARNVLDLIEYANGDAMSTYWGALRSANGHEQPFNIEYISLGNENWGDLYFRNFEALYKIVKEKYPDIKILSSAGTTGDGSDFDNAWSIINEKYKDTIVDEHYYTREYMFDNNARYDSYDRDGASVIVSEYAATCAGFGTMITKNNIWSAVEEASYMTGFERNSDIVKMASYAPTFAKVNSNSWDINMIWFDSQDVVLTPNYYVQMLYSNNIGTKYVDAQLKSDKDISNLYQSVTVDEDKQVMYIKLVNSGSAQKVNISLDGFENINYVSSQSISQEFKSASNEFGKQRIAPVEQEIETSKNAFEITAEKNSVNVIRVAYGSNTGESIYHLPDNIDLKTKKYLPISVKIIVAALCLAIPVGSVAGFFLYTKVISKKKRGKN